MVIVVVHPTVALQVTSPIKSLSTCSTRVWPFISVYVNVLDEIIVESKPFATVCTYVWLYTGMQPEMVDEL
jgi:hypothetical protein